MLEALGAAELATWRWDPVGDRLHVSGAVQALGLAPLAPDCASAAFLALTAPCDQAKAAGMLEPGPPGEEILQEIRLRHVAGDRRIVWRGARLENGGAAGVASAADSFVKTGRDGLTALLDRTAFLAHVDQRLKAPGAVRLICADLARLRRLNEALGPAGADLVLQALASRLASAFPPACAPARVGEDEFAILVEDDADHAEASLRIREALERPLRVRGFDIHPALWIAEILGRRRGARCARRAGAECGGPPWRSTPPNRRARRRWPWPRPVSAAMACRASLWRRICTARWSGARSCPSISPSRTWRQGASRGSRRWRGGSIRRAASCCLTISCRSWPTAGLMATLGRHMLKTSRRPRSPPGGPPIRKRGDLFVAVNLSTGELDDERLVDFVADMVRDYGLPPRALKVEITESDIMRDPERAAVVLEDLRRAGAGISLDDFRHRLLLPGLSHPPAVRDPEDRPLFRAHHGRQRRFGEDRALGRHARA